VATTPLAPRCAALPARLCEDCAVILVVFRSRNRPDGDVDEYQRRSKRMHELVQQHPGFISIESFWTPDGDEVSLEYFEDDESVKAWRDNPEHRETQQWAREHFYSWYSSQASEVIRAHEVDLMKRDTAKAAS
jgi:heme-degrading monooxygenase HmoA